MKRKMIQKMTKQIAHAEPFSGPARLTMPDIYGGSPDKPFIWRIPVLGERPVSIRIDGLPEGLTINGNIISGETPVTGDFPVVVTAANRLGSDRKTVTLSIRRTARSGRRFSASQRGTPALRT